MTTAADATLSRNHNGDILLIQPGQSNAIVAKVGTPLWFAIVNASPKTISPVGVTALPPRGLADPCYDDVDKLYERGWNDRHKGRDYDPRGTKEWQAVVDRLARGVTGTPHQTNSQDTPIGGNGK